jgi:sugar O-acyltransferase (sialic acid O-acetyltransferase NeuD family)
MKRVIIIGAGGHGREVADILSHQAQVTGDLTPLGFVDDNSGLHGQRVAGLPVLGDWTWFEGVDRTEVVVVCTAGSPPVCRRLAQRAEGLGLTFASVLSPLAHISPSARLGRGVTLFPNVVVNTDAQLGDHCILNVASTVSHDTRVGRYCNINPGVHLAGMATVGEGCYVGMGANVIQGVSIGDWTIVGAGAVVIRNLPQNVTAIGVPAEIIERRSEGWYER